MGSESRIDRSRLPMQGRWCYRFHDGQDASSFKEYMRALMEHMVICSKAVTAGNNPASKTHDGITLRQLHYLPTDNDTFHTCQARPISKDTTCSAEPPPLEACQMTITKDAHTLMHAYLLDPTFQGAHDINSSLSLCSKICRILRLGLR